MENAVIDLLEFKKFPLEYQNYFRQETDLIRNNIYGKVLDIGCGNVRVLPHIYNQCQKYIGIDIDENIVKSQQKIIKNNYPDAEIKMVNAKSLAKYFNANEVDISLCLWNTLHLIGDENQILNNISNITKDKIIITLVAKNNKSFEARKNYYNSFGIEHSIDKQSQTFYSKVWGESKAYTLSDLDNLSKESKIPLIKKGKIGYIGIYGIFQSRR